MSKQFSLNVHFNYGFVPIIFHSRIRATKYVSRLLSFESRNELNSIAAQLRWRSIYRNEIIVSESTESRLGPVNLIRHCSRTRDHGCTQELVNCCYTGCLSFNKLRGTELRVSFIWTCCEASGFTLGVYLRFINSLKRVSRRMLQYINPRNIERSSEAFPLFYVDSQVTRIKNLPLTWLRSIFMAIVVPIQARQPFQPVDIRRATIEES